MGDGTTKHIRVYFVTPDKDGILTHQDSARKGRAIAELNLDGSYIFTNNKIDESDKVKLFEHFIDDIKNSFFSNNT